MLILVYNSPVPGAEQHSVVHGIIVADKAPGGAHVVSGSIEFLTKSPSQVTYLHRETIF
jgi:hypothetical protein